ICSFDDKGTFLQVSAASARIWGYEPSLVVGKNIRDFILPEDIINTTALIERMKAGESVATNFENHFRRQDGSLVTLDWSAYWYEKERITFCVARDITLQKEIEQQLIASESRFRSFMDNSPAAAWICDEEGRYVYINKFVADHLSNEGYNSIGKSMFDLYPYEYAKLYHENNLEALQKNCALQFIEKGISQAGNTVLLVYKFPVLIAPGQRGIGGVAVDITDKTKAEEALRASEQNLKAIFTSTRDAFVLVNRDLRIVSYNPIAAELYSMLTNGGFIEDCEDIFILPPPDRRDIFQHNIMNAFKGQSLEYEVHYNLGNTSYWYNVVMQPVTGSSDLADKICLTISNITPRKRQEMTLALEKKVLEMNALPQSSLKDTVDNFLKGIEEIYPAMLCAVELVQDDITPLAAPSINNDDKLNLGSVIPITTSHNKVLANFKIYYTVPRQPLDYELKAIERATDILRVIIDNKLAEDNIRVSNQRYHFVTKATNEAIWDLDLALNNIYWAEGYYTLFGYDSSAGHGSLDQSHQRIHPHDLKRIKISLNSFLRKKTRTRWENEYRYRKA
ncbi:MAG TPA: PAS domain S-box protein, partial [Chitinophagaceae bacterium]|nr:PAS domain S-box protein [Chitinophagaceae bacterium]